MLFIDTSLSLSQREQTPSSSRHYSSTQSIGCGGGPTIETRARKSSTEAEKMHNCLEKLGNPYQLIPEPPFPYVNVIEAQLLAKIFHEIAAFPDSRF